MTDTPLPPLPVRAVQVLFSPGSLFDRLRERPVWLGALVVMAIVSAAAVLLIPGEIWMEMMERRIRAAGQEPSGPLPGGGIFRVFGAGAALVMTFVMAFVLSGVVTTIFAFILGDDGGFRQYLSVVAHAGLIQALGGLVTLPLKILGRDPELTLNLATFLPFLEEGYWYQALRMMDLFAIWALVVIAVGVNRIDPRRSWGFAASVLLALLGTFALVAGAFLA